MPTLDQIKTAIAAAVANGQPARLVILKCLHACKLDGSYGGSHCDVGWTLDGQTWQTQAALPVGAATGTPLADVIGTVTTQQAAQIDQLTADATTATATIADLRTQLAAAQSAASTATARAAGIQAAYDQLADQLSQG